MAEPRLWQDKELAGGPGNSEKERETQTGSFPAPQAYQYPPGKLGAQPGGAEICCLLITLRSCVTLAVFCSQTLFRTLLAIRIQRNQMKEHR